MKRFIPLVGCFFWLCVLWAGCSKQSETLSLPVPAEYYPLATGHVYTYRLDSSIAPYSGTDFVVHSYLAKDSIADTIRDNQDRLSYRVYRFVTDTLRLLPWQPVGTYYITPTDHAIEVMDENNLRFIKLKEPIRDDFNWQGNSYIDTRSAGSPFQYLDGWSYTYQNVGQSYAGINQLYDNTITILQDDETAPDVPFDPNNYQQRNYSVEVYAQGIGLVYKEFLHWTWQPTPPPAKYDNDSYGIKLTLVDYH